MTLMATVSPLKLVNKMIPAVKGIIQNTAHGELLFRSVYFRQVTVYFRRSWLSICRLELRCTAWFQVKQLDNVKVTTATGIIWQISNLTVYVFRIMSTAGQVCKFCFNDAIVWQVNFNKLPWKRFWLYMCHWHYRARRNPTGNRPGNLWIHQERDVFDILGLYKLNKLIKIFA